MGQDSVFLCALLSNVAVGSVMNIFDIHVYFAIELHSSHHNDVTLKECSCVNIKRM